MANSHHHERVTVSDIAQMTGYSTTAIYHWQRAGKLPPVAPPRQLEWYRRDIEQWIDENFDFD